MKFSVANIYVLVMGFFPDLRTLFFPDETQVKLAKLNCSDPRCLLLFISHVN